jgi:hypothetical protein
VKKISARDISGMKRELNAAIEAPKMNFNVAIFKACLAAGDIYPENIDKLALAFPEEVAFFKRWKEFGIDIAGQEQDFDEKGKAL